MMTINEEDEEAAARNRKEEVTANNTRELTKSQAEKCHTCINFGSHDVKNDVDKLESQKDNKFDFKKFFCVSMLKSNHYKLCNKRFYRALYSMVLSFVLFVVMLVIVYSSWQIEI
jgi:hypothetical protein